MTSGSHYKPIVVPVDGTVVLNGSNLGGFIPATAGSITITIIEGNGQDPITLPTIPVVAGAYLDLWMYVGTAGRSTFVASGGASGILLTT